MRRSSCVLLLVASCVACSGHDTLTLPTAPAARADSVSLASGTPSSGAVAPFASGPLADYTGTRLVVNYTTAIENYSGGYLVASYLSVDGSTPIADTRSARGTTGGP